jgi:anaerobic selenocysteine-containing dehydrogenase
MLAARVSAGPEVVTAAIEAPSMSRPTTVREEGFRKEGGICPRNRRSRVRIGREGRLLEPLRPRANGLGEEVPRVQLDQFGTGQQPE